MRIVILIAAFPATLLFAAQLDITAPISATDVRQIRKLVASETRDSIVGIAGARTNKPLPGAVPVSEYRDKDGRTVTTYDRADVVWVLTSHKHGHAMMYKLEKSTAGWKMVDKVEAHECR